MMIAVHREELVVGVGRHDVAGRGGELEAHQRRRRAADEEEAGDRDRIEDGDALVVVGGEPRAQRESRVEVARRRVRAQRRASGRTSLSPRWARGSVLIGDGPRGGEALDVGDQVEDLVLLDLPGEGRHDRGVAGGELLRRQQDRIAHVALVGDDRPSVREVHRPPEEPGEVRRVHARRWRRGSRCSRTRGTARRRARPCRGVARCGVEPPLEIRRFEHNDRGRPCAHGRCRSIRRRTGGSARPASP